LTQVQSQNYWAGLVQEAVAWRQDHVGEQRVTTQLGAMIESIHFSSAQLNPGDLLTVSITVRNRSNSVLSTQGPDPGFVYDEGDTFQTRGYPAVSGNFRVGLDFDNRTGVDHPYRWGLGSSLGPGESRTFTGLVRLQTPQAQKYWGGLVREFVAWLDDREGTQGVAVG
jgi:hypothetical protein